MRESSFGLTHNEIEFQNEIVPNFRKLGLCSLAEPRLIEAFNDDAFVVVNGLMLVKTSGDTVGIPLRENALSGGGPELNAWYEIDYGGPIGSGSGHNEWYKRTAIRNAFIQGETHISFSGVTKWLKLRQVRVDEVCPGEDLSRKAREAAEGLQQGRAMPDGLTRKEYLNRYLIYPEP